jgi:ATP-dependent RNA circularization protein (DNA/RNA ligase family)
MIIGKYAKPEFELLKDVEWVFTEKVDGTNVRVMWDGNRVTFNGKTDNAQLPTPLFYKLEELFMGQANEQKFEEIFGKEPACLYGEGFGNKIQAVGKDYNPDGVDFILFDVKIGDWWLERESLEDIAKKLDIKLVPIIFRGTLQEASDFVANGYMSTIAELKAEGLVGTPKTPMLTRRGERIITKIKSRDYDKLKD